MKKSTLKILAAAIAVILAAGFITGCKPKIVVEPYSIDLSTLLADADIKFVDPYSSSPPPATNLISAVVPWTSTICANLYKLGDGIFEDKEDACGICPTCEGKTHVVMNSMAHIEQWQDFPIYLPEMPEDIEWNKFNRVRIRVRYYYDDFEEVDPANNKVMVSFIHNPDGDWRGPQNNPDECFMFGKSIDDCRHSTKCNIILKQFNLTNGRRPGEESVEEDELPFGSRDGASGVSSNKGALVFLDRPPTIILFQNADVAVAYIEITEITFFRN
ncbi:MAG: hypothetical protein LBU88_02770 [Treponema sp.]|jgi:hypothetical protein|nr:hypothetical protein [Treponema sp.]